MNTRLGMHYLTSTDTDHHTKKYIQEIFTEAANAVLNAPGYSNSGFSQGGYIPPLKPGQIYTDVKFRNVPTTFARVEVLTPTRVRLFHKEHSLPRHATVHSFTDLEEYTLIYDPL